MPLRPGDRLGPYEIVSPLGAGGMGEVYKARDTRLDRSVAVKVLPEHIANRADLRQRFEREARAVASLNHPHICVLHDIGSQNGAGYMVMEHLEGETLAARIERGAIPLDQAIVLARQIADALDRAHRAGVTHRDLKPGNIMLTRDGAKLLDFGLAKSTARPAPNEETVTKALTAEGTVVGTPQYMAPEQFEGKEADARSDVWAFGAVLYEMVTGRRAFQGKSYSSLVGAILTTDPPPMSVRPFTPAWLERLVRRCLAKDPEHRYQSVRDVLLDLEAPPVEPVRQLSRWPWAVAAAACVLAAALGWLAWKRKPADPPLLSTLEISPPPGGRFASIGNAGGSAISPDGRTLAFVAVTAKGQTLLHLRSLDSLDVRALPGTEDAGRPFWSPDSKSLAFVARGKLKRIDLTGGSPIALCDANIARGGTWNKDGVILFGALRSGLQRVSASGGMPSLVTKLHQEAGEVGHYYPQFLPDGQQFLYTVRHSNPENAGIFAGSLDGKPPTKILQTDFKAAFDSDSGRLLYIQGDGTLLARAMELNPPRLTGDPAVVAEGIALSRPNGFADFSASGTLLYRRGTAEQSVRFAWRDRTGKALETVGQPTDPLTSFQISPDRAKVAYVAGIRGQRDIWILELTRGLSTRLTFGGAFQPCWSPDGSSIYYRSSGGTVLRKVADGSGEQELVLKYLPGGGGGGEGVSFSPDGRFLLYGSNTDIWRLALSGERKLEVYLQTKHFEAYPAFSPDGRWVAYHSNESGQFEVYVQGFPEHRGKWLVSTEGGQSPAWRADGKELYWVSPKGILMAARIDLYNASARSSRAEPLFSVEANFTPFQPDRDGRRFLVLKPEGDVPLDPPMVVVQNWAAGLGRSRR